MLSGEGVVNLPEKKKRKTYILRIIYSAGCATFVTVTIHCLFPAVQCSMANRQAGRNTKRKKDVRSKLIVRHQGTYCMKCGRTNCTAATTACVALLFPRILINYRLLCVASRFQF